MAIRQSLVGGKILHCIGFGVEIRMLSVDSSLFLDKQSRIYGTSSRFAIRELLGPSGTVRYT